MINRNFSRRALSLFALSLACIGSRADTLELLWEKAPGDYAWLGGAGSNTERGIAYNPVTKHVLVASRTGGAGIHILDAATGAEITVDGDPSTPKVLNMEGVGGGTFAISMVGVADDGVIYAANLTTGSTTSPYKIYRWANEDAAPTIAFEGDPSEGVTGAVRYGDSLDVRGAGANTQIMAGARTTPHVAFFTTADGENFSSSLVAGAGNSSGHLGVSFGAGNTGWSKINGSAPLRHFSFNLESKTAALIESVTLTPAALGPLGSDSIGKYLGVMAASDAPALTRVYDVSAGGAVLVGEQRFTTANPNSNGVGAADVGDNQAFFVNPNNGILALRIVQEITPVSIQTHPANTSVIEGGRVTLSVAAQGTPPLSYQWQHAGTNIPNATASSLVITNADPDDAGEYLVVVDNAGDPVPSNPATLTIQPRVRGEQLTLKWKKDSGELPFLSDDGTARGIAYNPQTGHVLVVSRTGGLAIHVLDGQTGNPIMNGETPLTLNLDPAIVTGASPADFRVNMIGVADDGAIYAANLTTGSGTSAFKVYRWDNESPDTIPYPVYAGDPSGGMIDPAPDKRFGDSFDVRGSGENTEILVGSRNGNVAVLIKPNADILAATATVIHAADVPNGGFGLSVAFGEGNSFYGDAPGQPTRLITYDAPVDGAPVVSGVVDRTFAAGEIPNAVANVAFDPASDFLAGNSLEVPDNVRLHKIGDDGSATLVDQELFELDAPNVNGTGALDFGGGMLFALNSNNGIMAFTFNPAIVQPSAPSLGAVSRAQDGTVTLTITGNVGASYTIQAANGLNAPIDWQTVQSVTIPAGGSSTVADAAAAGQSMRFYRALSSVNP